MSRLRLAVGRAGWSGIVAESVAADLAADAATVEDSAGSVGSAIVEGSAESVELVAAAVSAGSAVLDWPAVVPESSLPSRRVVLGLYLFRPPEPVVLA